MSRPNVTDDIAKGLEFARSCVLDQRSASHGIGNRTWDKQYQHALDSLDVVLRHHGKSKPKP